MTLSSTFYSSQDSFLVAVDCIILGFKENEISLLVHKREMEPAKGGMSLMGGFLQNDESLNQAATRVLTNLTGLENIFMEQVGTYGEIDRDPGERVISVCYYALIDLSSYDDTLLKKHNAFWVNINSAAELIFDHPQMVDDAITILRRKASMQPIGFNLLPEKFTLTQLQALYEAIYDHSMDKRNFRKKMLSMGFLQKTDEIDKSGSKKGAFYYQFKEDRNELLNTSYAF
ncbi:NUDIX hydrolase [Parabacteroides sp. FAFU027]|uniref:NUDIX hydrolase n=1 Tax=Parabacteroides sp. FAFU027 TaxID=2922715 RepID=UPI001FAF964D|nr:NUDIX domain-containing protein [Parabacteroides sp. FAFU027]